MTFAYFAYLWLFTRSSITIYIRYKTRTSFAKFYSFCWLSNLGRIYQKKLGPAGVMESGSHISYTKTLEEQTLVYLSISPPNLSMMLVWNNLADPHLSAFSDFARFSHTMTLKHFVDLETRLSIFSFYFQRGKFSLKISDDTFSCRP